MWPLAECISSVLVWTPSLQLGVLQSLRGSFLLCPILLSHFALSYLWWKPGWRHTKSVTIYHTAQVRHKGVNPLHVWHYLYTGDTSSTSNLCQHAKVCWGGEVISAADTTGNTQVTCKALSKKTGLNGSITSAFEWLKKSKVTYSQQAHSKLEAW